MDINCTNSCAHQQDGKCSLNKLPSMTSSTNYNYDYIGFECPYFSEAKQVKKT